MKNTYQAVLAIALALTSVMTVKASSGWDLIVGFTKGSGNDFMLDIGPVSSSAYPGAPGLSNGETWNLNATNQFTSQSYTLSSVNWGVIGDATYSDGASTQTLWVTTSGYTPPSLSSSALSVPDGGISDIEQDDFGGLEAPPGYESNPGQTCTTMASFENSWDEQTISGTLAGDFGYAYTDPNVSGETSDILWQVPANGSTPTAIGTFTLNSSGVLTFNFTSASAPAPKITRVSRSGSTTTVYFSTVSSHIYTMYFTNAAGLLAPLSKWPTNTITSNGTGGTNSLTDTTSTGNRFYVIGVH